MTTVVQGSGAPVRTPPANHGSDCLGRMWDVYTESMNEGGTFLKSAFRLTNAATFWAKYFNPETPKAVSDVGAFSKQAKNIISIAEAPMRIEKAVKSVANFNGQAPFKSAANVTAEMCGLVSTGCDTIDFLHTVASPMPEEVMSGVKTASYVSTFVGSLKGTADSVEKLGTICDAYNANEAKTTAEISDASKAETRDKIKSKITSNLIGLATKVTYLVLGALGLISLFVPIAPVAIVACVTLGTLLGFAGFFYDKVVDPNDDKAKKMAQSPFFQRAVELSAIAP